MGEESSQPISLGGTSFLDYFGYLISGYFFLIAFFDFFPLKSDIAVTIVGLGFVLSILIYGICYVFYEGILEVGTLSRILKLLRFIIEGNSY